ncbi:MAG: PD-(D/E)XK nuclease family protein [Parachlamydiales bacterium]
MTYNAQRTRNLFLPSAEKPFKLSRTKIQNFLDCPRCFYLDRRCGTGQPGGAPFRLNTAVDTLLKKEFDQCRSDKKPHPLMIEYGIDAIPFPHPDLDVWRANFQGVQYHHEATNLIITGAVDDLWINSAGELIVVDYKATSTPKEIQLDDSDYKTKLKKQIEVYQWLLRRRGFLVSNTGYFVYCNGDDSKDKFDGKLEFSISIIPYTGDDSWIEPTLFEICKCLQSDILPLVNTSCDYCRYWSAVKTHVHVSENCHGDYR